MSPNHVSWPEAKAYFRHFSNGKSDESGAHAFIYAQDLIRESDNGSLLYIGRAGAGGIEFVYQRGSPEIFAFYPLEGEFTFLAEGIEEFVELWLAGQIEV